MRRHIDVLAHGLRFYGALVAAVCSIVGVGVGGLGVALGEPGVAAVSVGLVLVGGVAAAPFLITGRGLLQRRAWARPAGLVLSILILGDLPIGASLGLLGLGVLLDDDVARAFSPVDPRPLLGPER